jgi:N-methylhydantoinase A/oxoprolinase/acetone carboxylase beta subunit
MANLHEGILSAYGMGLADTVFEVQEPCALKYSKEALSEINKTVEKLCKVNLNRHIHHD